MGGPQKKSGSWKGGRTGILEMSFAADLTLEALGASSWRAQQAGGDGGLGGRAGQGEGVGETPKS